MPLDPAGPDFLDQLAAPGLPLERRRRDARTMFQPCRAGGTPQEVAGVEDIEIPGPAGNQIPVRGYTATPASSTAVVVYFHRAAGFVIGNIETHDATLP